MPDINLLLAHAKNKYNILNDAKDEFDSAFDAWFNELENSSENTFWFLLEKYRNLLVEKNLNTKDAAEKLFQLSLPFGRSMGIWTYTQACQFAKTYFEKCELLYTPLFDVVQNKSDDAYSDLLDNLPLAGQTVYSNCLQRKFTDDCEVQNAVAEGGEPLNKEHIWTGENYNRMYLLESAKFYFK